MLQPTKSRENYLGIKESKILFFFEGGDLGILRFDVGESPFRPNEVNKSISICGAAYKKKRNYLGIEESKIIWELGNLKFLGNSGILHSMIRSWGISFSAK